VWALTAAKVGTTQNMRLVCLPSELSVFWSAGVGAPVGLGTAAWGVAWVPASGCDAPVLPDCPVCCASAASLDARDLSGPCDPRLRG
jgi:hypothetical protein